MDRADVAWAAGLFEGEGSIGTFRSKNCETPRLVLSMTDYDVIVRLHQTVGFGRVNGPYQRNRAKPTWKPQWVWSVTGFERVQALLAAWWPWLGARRRAQVTAVLMRARARPVPARNRVACPKGHLYDARRNSKGARICSICQRASNRRSSRRYGRSASAGQLRLVE
jgi:hypothetical protein